MAPAGDERFDGNKTPLLLRGQLNSHAIAIENHTLCFLRRERPDVDAADQSRSHSKRRRIDLPFLNR
ncbi:MULTISPECIES: hypothetical protein [unclassified Beijerinckia]|uniref:hypothetical protein n=1 Tax=unclassified Beijerinckia TaxID=2638183 RepID=UPI000B83B518|nr:MULTISPECIES: hypothetical protein [unclassified Beijerinckia]MDH7799046.1 hypothetical protein [Beijerinckia sp. GAS462]